MTYKKNQWVKINESGKIGQIIRVQEGDICTIEVDGVIIGKYLDFFELSPAPKTWNTLEVGNIVVNTNGSEAKVLAIIGDVFLRSMWGSFSISSDSWYTKTEAEAETEECGWKIKGTEDENIQEVTMQEVCEKFGKEVKIKKA